MRQSGWKRLAVRMDVKWILWGVFPFFLILSNISHASVVSIDVLETEYTTVVSRSLEYRYFSEPYYWSDSTQRTTVSTNPINDYIYAEGCMEFGGGYCSFAEASANAKLFEVSVQTKSGGNDPNPYSYASATTEIAFSPLMDSSNTIGLYFAGWYEWNFSDGYVKLFDVTSNLEMWNYHWEGPYSLGNISWVIMGGSGNPDVTAALSIDTSFVAGHRYELVMFASSNSEKDWQRIEISLSGLEPTHVPEPSAMLLLGSGMVGLLGYSRKLLKKRQSDQWN